jgi:uncharacterized protein YfaP (DUF2135 family)
MNGKNVFSYLGTVAVLLTLTLTGCGGGSSSGGGSQTTTTTGTITGKIINNSDGTAVASATVTVGTAMTSTDANGSYTLNGITAGADNVINVTGPGFARGSKIATVTSNLTTRADLSLLPIAYTTVFDPATAQTLSANAAGTAQVALPANALVTAAGAVPTGNVTVNITPVDPTSNPQLMPGNFSATVGTGAAVSNGIIETFGAMEVTFTDSSNAALNLAGGQSATIRIPVATGVNSPPATMPAYYYNATTGKWIEEGTLTLAGTAPDLYYTGSVTHFSYWNADMPLVTTCISGKVVSSSNVAVAGAHVVAQGRDYIGTSETYTAADGTFTLPVKQTSGVIVYAITNDALSQSVVVTSGVAGSACTTLSEILKLGSVIGSPGSGSAKITLTWGTDPSDLDSHLTGPDPSGTVPGLTDPNRFHVFFAAKGNLAAPPFASLDVDDVTSFGPEVTTISQFFPGVYRYSVHHFSGAGTIFSSPARVELTLNGVTQVFTPPVPPGATTIGVDTVWQVFEINVSSSGAATVTPLNSYLLGVSTISVTSVNGPVAQPYENPLIFSNLPAK